MYRGTHMAVGRQYAEVCSPPTMGLLNLALAHCLRDRKSFLSDTKNGKLSFNLEAQMSSDSAYLSSEAGHS